MDGKKEYKSFQELMEAFLMNGPRKMEDPEAEGFAGIEGIGYIVEIEPKRMFVGHEFEDEGHFIIMDVEEGWITVQVIYADGTVGDTWRAPDMTK